VPNTHLSVHLAHRARHAPTRFAAATQGRFFSNVELLSCLASCLDGHASQWNTKTKNSPDTQRNTDAQVDSRFAVVKHVVLRTDVASWAARHIQTRRAVLTAAPQVGVKMQPSSCDGCVPFFVVVVFSQVKRREVSYSEKPAYNVVPT
jgi:hypothetical protein